MYFADTIDPAFGRWLRKDTCFSGHPYDDARFYLFVRALVEHGRPDETTVVETIVRAGKEMHPTWGDDYIEGQARKCGNLVQNIYDYLDAPDVRC